MDYYCLGIEIICSFQITVIIFSEESHVALFSLKFMQNFDQNENTSSVIKLLLNFTA